MNRCYHSTKLSNLKSILQDGLRPNYGSNSSLIADQKKGKLYYSVGEESAVKMFSNFNTFFYRVVDGFINEESFKVSLSPDEYQKHQQNVQDIIKCGDFDEYFKDQIYLSFKDYVIDDRHEEDPVDSYTSEPIPSDQLKVCVIRSKANDSICTFSMIDIYCYLHAKHPEYEEGLETWDYKTMIDRYRGDNYYMDYISLERFCELYPDLVTDTNDQSKAKFLNRDEI